jgi:hypothetical protein
MDKVVWVRMTTIWPEGARSALIERVSERYGVFTSTTLIWRFRSRALPTAAELVVLPIAFRISDRTRFEKAPAGRNAFLS